MKFQPIIDIHASWLAVNPLQGCINGCSYCFLSTYDLHNKNPMKLCSPSDAINMLLNYKYYDEESIVCFFTLTDIFLNEETIKYFKDILKEINNKRLKNTLVFITKLLIPDKVIEILNNMEQNVIIYLSYSGLDSSFEKEINHDNILCNFSRLFNKNIKVIHYWR